jgi:uncharacterized OB-fold protein
VDVPYKFAAGQYMSRFLIELWDNGRFYGIRCPRCGRVQMPPRVVCAVCHVRNREWVELGHEGMLLGFSIVHLPLVMVSPLSSHLIKPLSLQGIA